MIENNYIKNLIEDIIQENLYIYKKDNEVVILQYNDEYPCPYDNIKSISRNYKEFPIYGTPIKISYIQRKKIDDSDNTMYYVWEEIMPSINSFLNQDVKKAIAYINDEVSMVIYENSGDIITNKINSEKLKEYQSIKIKPRPKVPTILVKYDDKRLDKFSKQMQRIINILKNIDAIDENDQLKKSNVNISEL